MILVVSLFLLAMTSGFAYAVTYKDTNKGDWYHRYISFVTNNKIMNGDVNGYFKPDKTVTKADLSAALYKYNTYINKEIDSKIANGQDDERKTISAIAKAMPSVVYVQAPNAIGTGFFISEKTILTNHHVINTATTGIVKISLVTGQEYTARILKSDANKDLALLEVQGHTGFNFLEFTDSKVIGQTILVLGHPTGIPFTASKGIVSRTDLHDTNYYMDLIQLDTPINPGNSGSPAIGYDGKAVGIVASKYAGDMIDSMGFAISYKTIKEFLQP